MLQQLPISNAFESTFLTLQALVVAFLLFHDWIPLGRLSNLAAIRGQDTLLHRVFVTLLLLCPRPLACSSARDISGDPTRTGSRCCFGSLMACSSSACSARGGYLTWLYRTRSGPPAIKLSSPARTRSCPAAMEWPRTLYIPCFISSRWPRWSPFS
jgi:hypothetical protein